jgi:hypothetical protein
MDLKISFLNSIYIMVVVKTIDMKNYRNTYYHEKLKNTYSTKILCEVCDKEVNLSSFRRHIKTNSHLNKMNCNECKDNTTLIEKILTRLIEPNSPLN